MPLKAQNCVFVPVWDTSNYPALRAIVEACPAFAGSAIQKATQYLCIELGVASSTMQWGPMVEKFVRRAREVLLAGASSPARVALFTFHVMSSFLCKGRFCAPIRAALDGSRRAAQVVLAAFWMAHPPDLSAISACGCRGDMVDIGGRLGAARYSMVRCIDRKRRRRFGRHRRRGRDSRLSSPQFVCCRASVRALLLRLHDRHGTGR